MIQHHKLFFQLLESGKWPDFDLQFHEDFLWVPDASFMDNSFETEVVFGQDDSANLLDLNWVVGDRFTDLMFNVAHINGVENGDNSVVEILPDYHFTGSKRSYGLDNATCIPEI